MNAYFFARSSSARAGCWMVALLTIAPLAAQNNRSEWSKPFPPHKVIGNVYFVGTVNLGSYLITTPEGHILLNTDFEETVPVIRAAVEKLGFKFTDIKIILGSHAHGDHMEGDAMAKELTAARVMAMEQDVPALKKMMPGGKEHPIDRVLHDGDEVKLGGSVLTAHLTAGHTKGCTTWSMKATEAGKTYDVVVVCSVGFNAGYLLVNNKDYPQIADDFVRSFAATQAALRYFPGGAHRVLRSGGEVSEAREGRPESVPRSRGVHGVDLKAKQFNDELARQKSAGRP
jgi:metallo-beta-lactamase class B